MSIPETDLRLPSATSVPAADVTAPVNSGQIIHQSFPLRQPEEEANEILVQVRGSSLRKIRRRLDSLVSPRFPWPEVLLGLSTLSFGGSLGAVASRTAWATVENGVATLNWVAFVFYALFPMIGVGAAVGYASLRYFTARNASSVAQDMLEELPDPDRAK